MCYSDDKPVNGQSEDIEFIGSLEWEDLKAILTDVFSTIDRQLEKCRHEEKERAELYGDFRIG